MKKFLSMAAACMVMVSTQARADKCEDITAYQEWVHGIPTHLLTAIAHAESGQWNEEAGTTTAWPWTVTSPEGDVKHPTKWAAIEAVRDLRKRGVKNIDVGCMQINLKHHPRAFRNLNIAFNPAHNVAYAARFLKKLHRQTGDWRTAVAYYHSRKPEHYGPYQAKVEKLWQEAREASGITGAYPGPTYAAAPSFAREPAYTYKPRKPRRYWRQWRQWRRQHGWPAYVPRYSFITRPVGGGAPETIETEGPWVPVIGGRFH